MEKSLWENPFKMEMKCAEIISNQAKNGVNFDARKAHWNVFLLTEKIINIDKQLIPMLPKMLNTNNKNFYKKPFKLNGQFMGYVQKYADSVGLERKEVGGPFSPVWYTHFDVSKSARVKALMLDLGWMPTEWNIKKQDWITWDLKRKVKKKSYREFINSCCQEDKEFIEERINAFLQHHFVDKSTGYKKAVVSGLGFSIKRPPTFDQIKLKLLTNQFWITSPKITEDSFTGGDSDEGVILTLLKERMVWSHRRSLIQGLIGHIREDGKLSGEANPCATPTTRMRHRIVVNIPAGHAQFGQQCRSMFVGDKCEDETRGAKIIHCPQEDGWRVRKNTNWFEEFNKKSGTWEKAHLRRYYLRADRDAFVGGDGAGLELRMLTHYLIYVSKKLLAEAEAANDAAGIRKYKAGLESAYEYRRVLLEGDIHTHNQTLAGLPTRNAAKTFIYAFLYGAGDANLGSQLGAGKEEGAKLRKRFLEECPCIPILIEWVQEQAAKNGYLIALDGRKLIMRRDAVTGEVMTHKALNTLLQAAGSIVMKLGMCYLDAWTKKLDMKAHQVLMIHDECQFTCPWEEVQQLRNLIDRFVSTAGKALDMEIELSSDNMFGTNWLETH